MLLEKYKKQNEILEKDEKLKDLIFDLESYVIDLFYNEDETVDRLELKGRARLVHELVDKSEINKAHAKISPVLSNLGIHSGVKGYRLIEYCVLEGARNILSGKCIVMKKLYSDASKVFGISTGNCERLCRYACSHIQLTNAFLQKYPSLEGLFHRTYERVTVKELVESLSGFLVVECKFKSKLTDDN